MRSPSGVGAEVLHQLHTAVPDLQFAVQDLLADEDRIAARWSARGTYAGQPLSDTGLLIAQLADRRITELWSEPSTAGPAAADTPPARRTPLTSAHLVLQRAWYAIADAHSPAVLSRVGAPSVSMGDSLDQQGGIDG